MNLFWWLANTAFWATFLWVLPALLGVDPGWFPTLDRYLRLACNLTTLSRVVDAIRSRRRTPGNWWWAAYGNFRTDHTYFGLLPIELLRLHERYRSVVRTGPNELSFNSLEAMRQIYQESPEKFTKDPRIYLRSVNGEYDLHGNPDTQQHSKHLQAFGPSFTEGAVKEQEALVHSHVDHLIDKLKALLQPSEGGAAPSTVVDLQHMVNLLTGDIAEDLTTGSSAHRSPAVDSSAGMPDTSVVRGSLSPWLQGPRQSLSKPMGLMILTNWLGFGGRWVEKLKWAFYPYKQMRTNFDAVVWRLPGRRSLGLDKSDWLTSYLRWLHNNPPQTERDKSSTLREIQANTAMLQHAGSAKTASTIAAIFYFLGQSSDALSTLTSEIRTRCPREDRITFYRLARLPYLDGVIRETLRMHPPTPFGFPRVTNADTVVDDVPVKKGTIVSVNPYVMGRSTAHFHAPNTFAPERWLPCTPPAFVNDVRKASAPFSLGPHSCLGERFAFAEMRLVVAKLLFHFDVEHGPGMDAWLTARRSWLAWEERPVMVKLTARGRA